MVVLNISLYKSPVWIDIYRLAENKRSKYVYYVFQVLICIFAQRINTQKEIKKNGKVRTELAAYLSTKLINYWVNYKSVTWLGFWFRELMQEVKKKGASGNNAKLGDFVWNIRNRFAKTMELYGFPPISVCGHSQRFCLLEWGENESFL